MKKKIVIIVFAVLLVGVATLVYRGQREVRLAKWYYSGTIEATQADLAFQVGGRVDEVLVDEGLAVEKGQPLAFLEKDELTARRDQARANLDRAREALGQAEKKLAIVSQSLPVELERAQAVETGASYQLAELQNGFRAQEVEQARLSAEVARLAMEEVKRDKDRYDALFQKRVVAAKEKESVDLRYETALRNAQRAAQSYALHKEGARAEVVDRARAQLAQARAAVKLARSNLRQIDIAKNEVEAARSQVRSSESALALARIQLSHATLTAPISGLVVSRSVEPGEVVSPGQEVISLADLSRVDLKIFVDETEIGGVKPGGRVDVKIDTFPDKTYPGLVSYVSPEAEFTPKIIQTHKERVKLVYLVKITVDNPDRELKTGMPADVWFK